jgi:hypothetical protein
MILMAIQTDLSMNDFTKYFEANKLGKLYFPNGECFTSNGNGFENGEITKFHVDLSDLYKLVTGWKINKTEVPLDDILGVIAFGSAVKHPGYEEVPILKRKYFLFGPKEDTGRKKKVLIEPDDADFLVITGRDLIREKVLKPISLNTYDCRTWIKEGGIHLVNRGANQIINGTHSNDTISISALREGVPVFYNKERLEEVVKEAGVSMTTPRKLSWDKDNSGYLTGKIE